MSMEELRNMAHAYYENVTNVDVLVSFEAFKQAMSSALMFPDFSYYMEKIGYDPKSGICSQKFFNELNEDRSGVLNASDLKTLFYIVKGGIPLFCDGDCKRFLKVNSYFTCVNCFENGSEFSFNVCYNCFTGRMFVHHDHEDEGQPEAFLDPTVILNFIRAEKALKNQPAAHYQTSTNMNYQQSAPDAGTSSLPSSSTSTALVLVENPQSKKLKKVDRALALMQLLVSSGNLVAATLTCTVM